jgi:hypothetical protein
LARTVAPDPALCAAGFASGGAVCVDVVTGGCLAALAASRWTVLLLTCTPAPASASRIASNV